VAHVIAVANHKGGVGKTVTAVNLAAGLARAGQRTLLVDTDPQAQSTFWFVDDPAEVEADLQDAITRGTPVDSIILPTRIGRLELLPSTLALARLDLDLMTMVRREDRVRMVLGQVRDRYAYIVLDLAPSLSLVTLAALAAATDLVTPVNPERLAVNGLGTFLGWVDDFRREDVITAPLLGVLITKADLGADGQPRTRVGRESLEALQASGLPLFKTIVPRRVGVEDQVGDRLVVGDRGAAPAVFQAYEQFVGEVLTLTKQEASHAR
jgi:chromosome partitioning protein